MGTPFLFYVVLIGSIVFTGTAVPVPHVDIVSTSSIQIEGIVRRGQDPVHWDEQLGNSNSEQFKQLNDSLCNTFYEALKVIKDKWTGCEVLKFNQNATTMVYATAIVSIKEDPNLDLDMVREQLNALLQPSSYETVLGGDILVNTYSISIGGVVQQGPYPIKWIDAYFSNSSEEYKQLQEQLCKSITEAETSLSNAVLSCEFISVQPNSNDNSQVYTLIEIKLQKSSIDLEKLKLELEKVFSESTNALSLGNIVVNAPEMITTSSMDISGIVLIGQEPLKWDPQYGIVGGPIYLATQQAICSNIYKVFAPKGITPSDCYLKNMKQNPTNAEQVYAEATVVFDPAVTVNIEEIKLGMEQLGASVPEAVIIGRDIVITASEVTTTTASSLESTTPSNIEEITTSSLTISGTMFTGKTPVPWDPAFEANNGELFNIMQQALCSSFYKIFQDKGIKPSECILNKLKQESVETNHAHANVSIKFNPEVTVNVDEIRKAMEQLVANDPQAVIIGGDIVITASEETTMTSTMIEEVTTTTEEVTAETEKVHTMSAATTVEGETTTASTMTEEVTTTTEEVTTTTEEVTTTTTTKNTMSSTTTVEGITVPSLQISGTVVVGKDPMTWNSDFAIKTSAIFRQTQRELCDSIRLILLEIKVTYKDCSVVEFTQLNEKQVHGLVKVVYEGDAPIVVDAFKKAMQELAQIDTSATIIGGDVDITIGETTIPVMTTTSTAEEKTTVATGEIITKPPTEGITTSSVSISGILFTGERAFSWSQEYNNQSSPEFKSTQKALCKSLGEIIFNMLITVENCNILKMSDAVNNHVQVTVSVKFDTESKINIEDLKQAMKDLAQKDPDATIIGDEIKITTGEETSTTSTMTEEVTTTTEEVTTTTEKVTTTTEEVTTTTEVVTTTTEEVTTTTEDTMSSTTTGEEVTVSSLQISGTVFVGPDAIKWKSDLANNSSAIFRQNQRELCDSIKMILSNMKITVKDCNVVEFTQTNENQVHGLVKVTYDSDAAAVDVEAVKEAMKDLGQKDPYATIIGGDVNIVIEETTTTMVTTTTSTEEETTTVATEEMTTMPATEGITTSSLSMSGILFVGERAFPWNPDFTNQSSPDFKSTQKALCKSFTEILLKMQITVKGCNIVEMSPAAGEQVQVLVSLTFEKEATINVEDVKQAMKDLAQKDPDATIIGGDIVIVTATTTTSPMTTVTLGLSEVSTIQIGGIVMDGGKPLPWKEEYGNKQGDEFKGLQELVCDNFKAALPDLQKNWKSCSIIDIQNKDSKTYVKVEVLLNVAQTLDLDETRRKVEKLASGSSGLNKHVQLLDFKGINE